ncbi:glutamate--tRNA ligase [Zeaxanthinibacter sp. PT1]|uniref:glutamate--tRNA ligase n=1 Tax=Zeaxanthinibacter TaxID=561554 RepID=UPI0023491809|nr:glutamate--tRNA ligase [Zeaxanthinibacter sp. PT1]MDC6350640.1 glutamate--tRNA ligase [Zeaxanthinibacter sp. PT1]
MNKRTRVRFAPSPTGPLHIGGVRTALFNYLFAKKEGGDFILRIEDTDQNRYVEGAEAYIVEALSWCGIQCDEGPHVGGDYGPYRQSERKAIYAKYADQLIREGKAYYAFDTAEELDEHRKDHEAKGKTFIYNWHNREKLRNSLSLSKEETSQLLDEGTEYVIRFKSPAKESLELHDIIRGQITIDTATLDDKVLFKSDGMPTYHLANIVDDHLMEISHVIRGEEWLPSLALHQLLYNAFGWEAPQFAHLPLIMKPVGKGKLSKRDGEKLGFPVFPLQWGESRGYKEDGYLPEAVINFLALLGWNPGTEQEIFSMEELMAQFSLERVNKSGARFDPEKTKWYNQHYIQQLSAADLARRFQPLLNDILDEKGKALPGIETIEKVVALVKERASFIQDLWPLTSYFFIAPESYDEKAAKKQWKDGTPGILKDVLKVLLSENDFSSEPIEKAVKEHIQEQGLSFGQVMPPLRLAIVGAMQGPHLFDIISQIGAEETRERIEKAIDTL